MGVLFDQPFVTQELLAVYNYKTKTDNSYELFLKQGKLCWRDGSKQPLRVWEYEPEVSFLKRVLSKIMSWLPIESQL